MDNLIDKYLGERKNIIGGKGLSLSKKDIIKLYKHFYKEDIPRNMPYGKAGEMIVSKYSKNKIKGILGEVGLTKPKIFKKIMNILSGSDWMSVDEISAKAVLPMSKHGLEAHIMELVKKGKLDDTMKKGKYVYKIK